AQPLSAQARELARILRTPGDTFGKMRCLTNKAARGFQHPSRPSGSLCVRSGHLRAADPARLPDQPVGRVDTACNSGRDPAFGARWHLGELPEDTIDALIASLGDVRAPAHVVARVVGTGVPIVTLESHVHAAGSGDACVRRTGVVIVAVPRACGD